MASPGQSPLPSSNPSNAAVESRGLVAEAWELLSQGRIPESEVAFKRVIELSVDAVVGVFGLGTIQLKRGDYPGAAVMFENCLRLDPQNAAAYYYLGEAWEKRNVPDAALAFFRKALAIDPHCEAARQKLGVLTIARNPETAGVSRTDNLTGATVATSSAVPSTANKNNSTVIDGDNKTLGTPPGFIRGRVTLLRQRIESLEFVRDFRLEPLDPNDASLTNRDVQMRVRRERGFEGSIINGDIVEVMAGNKSGGTLVVRDVRNLTTNSIVRVRRKFRWRKSVFPVMPGAEKYGLIRGRVVFIHQISLMGLRGRSPGVWTLRLRREGSDGKPLPLVEIEMRGISFVGSVVENDEIEVDASGYKTGDVIGVRKVWNVTSNAVFRAIVSHFYMADVRLTLPRR